MASGVCIKTEPTESDEPESHCLGCACKAEEIYDPPCSENTILKEHNSDVPPISNEQGSLPLMYNDKKREMENTENESNEMKEVEDEDAIDTPDLVQNVKHQHKGNPKSHDCPYCSQKCKSKWHLDAHIRTHTGEKPYKCSYCDKAFALKSVLKAHIRTHTGEKPYKCSYCDKSFSLKRTMVNHERTHTGEKPFKCSYCDKAFITRTHLSDHLRTHPKKVKNQATQTENHDCVDQCTLMYDDKEKEMENGERESSEIKEEVSDEDTIDVNEQNTVNKTDVDDNVDEDFEMNESLSTIIAEMKKRMDLVQNVQHQHKGNRKSHDCSYCSKKCPSKSKLDRHLQTHTREKPYECSYCDTVFAQRQSLVKHVRLHNG